jgi:hypothetical protein
MAVYVMEKPDDLSNEYPSMEYNGGDFTPRDINTSVPPLWGCPREAA